MSSKSHFNFLPPGWTWTTLGEICPTTSGGTPSRGKPNYYGGAIPWLKSGELNDGLITTTEETITQEGLDNSSAKVFPKGTLLTALYGATVGRLGVLGIDAATNQAICAIFVPDEISSKYIFWYLTDQRDELLNARQGGAQPNISQGVVSEIKVPLPPLPEQHCIVAKIEELFSKLDAGVEALKKVKAELKRYHQSVLKHAFEGKLTEEWRKNLILKETKRSKSDYRMVAEPAAIYELKDRSDSSSPSTIQNDMQYEPASVLLARIREERKKKLGSKYKEPEPIDTSELPELPEGWVWAKVMEAGRVQLGRQRAPQYHNGNDMRPYLRVANVFENRIDTSDILQMNFDPDVYETFKLHYGDILLNEGQSPEFLGRPAMYRNEVPGACFQNTLIRFQAASGLMPEYALAVFRGYLHTGRFRKTSQITTNLAHMSAGRFAEIEFPLPSQAEQQAIVNELDRVFSIADAVEKTVDEQLQQAERLRQSILKRAFEGKLVPQDPTDPPASVLLEQIKLEKENRREESGAGSKKKRKTIIGTFN